MQLDEKLAELKEKAADNQVLEADLAKVISLWTGIPATKIEQNDVKKLANLENELKEHIIGQDVAIKKVANPLTMEPNADIVVFIIFPAPFPRRLIPHLIA